MKEVVVIKIVDRKPKDIPEFLSKTYACTLAYYKGLLKAIRRDREGGANLLDELLKAKRKLQNIKQALNGKHNIIVIVDLTVPRQSLFDIIARERRG